MILPRTFINLIQVRNQIIYQNQNKKPHKPVFIFHTEVYLGQYSPIQQYILPQYQIILKPFARI